MKHCTIKLAVDKFLKSGTVAFVSGDFNVLHLGHIRLLNFAKTCADTLVVGINPDSVPSAVVPSDIRIECLSSLGVVDYAFILETTATDFIQMYKPNVVVKGSEHREQHNDEESTIKEYGGKLIFSSGDSMYNTYDLLHQDRISTEYKLRHDITNNRIQDILEKFAELKIVVVGDLIVDEYVSCEALGMSREDPTIVVKPVDTKTFLGGAGIVAAHATGLGGKVTFHTVHGPDHAADFASHALSRYNVKSKLIVDETRPTTLKRRYRANGKTLLRVSSLSQHEIAKDIVEKLNIDIKRSLKNAQLLIFSDFNYGCLPQELVEDLIEYCHKNGIYIVADSQSSSQIGNIVRFRGAHLITPTEHEARLALGDSISGLVKLAENLKNEANCRHTIITLGADGAFVHDREHTNNLIITDTIPAFSTKPVDVSGAGDCLLTASAMSLVAGANIWEAAYIGSCAAAAQVSRIGNTPIAVKDITDVMEGRF